MWYLKHVFGILTLQTGTIVLSSLFITLGICVLFVNVSALDTELPQPWIIMFLFVCYMIVIWLISFYGAYKESRNAIFVATVLWTISIITWCILVILSFMYTQAVCIQHRCPDVLWLLNNPWHEKQGECKNVSSSNNYIRPQYEKPYKLQVQNVKLNTETVTEDKRLATTIIKVSSDAIEPFATVEKHENRSEIETKLVLKKCFGIPLVQNNQGFGSVSIIVLLLYLLLSLFSWMILFSYREEIIVLQPNSINNI